MAVRFQCPTCGKKLKATDEAIGKKVLCSGCGNPTKVPEEDTIKPSELKSSAANLAGDLLKQTHEKSKEKYSKYEEPPSAANQAIEEMVDNAKSLALQIVPAILVILALFILTYWLSISITTTGSKYPPLGRVSGVVMLDGSPMPGASVTFFPLDKETEDGIKISASMGMTDAQGKYELTYVKDVPGAYIGKHSVRITGYMPNGKPLPVFYNTQTQLIESVEPGSNTIDFKLNSF